nr:unnamed protein product [Timema douglasi]
MNSIYFIGIILFTHTCTCENVHMTKVFILPIEPSMFNWTLQGETDQYSYRPSLLNAPDLPSWIHYTYSKHEHIGYLYGVPPLKHKDIDIEIVGLNQKTYETGQTTVHMKVHEKVDPARYEVQLKINNMNVENMFDTQRLKRLLDVFRQKLWKESEDDLYVTFLASAVELGARLPLLPDEKEGIVMRIGSQATFSSLLIDLQEEVKPLWKLNTCPRNFKRTTVEWLFRDAGFALDWCTFRLVEDTSSSLRQHAGHVDTGIIDQYRPLGLGKEDRWSRPTKSGVPQRSYVGEFVLTLLVPMLVMLVLVLMLSLILCFHHEGITKRNNQTPATQMVQYTAVQKASHTLRSLSSQRQVSISTSEQCSSTVSRSRTGSPNSSLPRTASPRLSVERNSFYRPNPPPYTGPANSIGNHAGF